MLSMVDESQYYSDRNTVQMDRDADPKLGFPKLLEAWKRLFWAVFKMFKKFEKIDEIICYKLNKIRVIFVALNWH